MCGLVDLLENIEVSVWVSGLLENIDLLRSIERGYDI